MPRPAAGLLVVALAATPAAAQAPAAEIALDPPASLRVGDRAAVVAEVRIRPAGTQPLLLTPSTEGTAVEVVRGRLLRSDAEDRDADVLRFRIPIVARTPGTGVLRVAVSGWACAERCRRVTAEASVVLRVQRAEIDSPTP
jgi:hypothetical protein